ncbi:MAG: hypothetical protein RQ757_02105 [Pseudomonadales bacterium]|nr:hypothetical protein [Pseudomonadales bacterium]
MKQQGIRQEKSLHRRVTLDGKSVTLEVRQIDSECWTLSILGKGDQVSEWLTCFGSASEAMTAGLLAIRHDGIEEYFEDPAFQQPALDN